MQQKQKRRDSLRIKSVMEVLIDSSVILDSLEEFIHFSDGKKNEDRVAIDKIVELKQNDKIVCIRTINTEFEIAKETRQEAIDKKWGKFIIRDAGIGLKASLRHKHYDEIWDRKFNEIKGDKEKNHIDASIVVQAEYFNIKYIVTTDYKFIKRHKNKQKIIEVIRPVDFLRLFLGFVDSGGHIT